MLKKLIAILAICIALPYVTASAERSVTVNNQKNFDAYTYTSMPECYSYYDPNYDADAEGNFGILGKYFQHTMGGEYIVFEDMTFGELGAKSIELNYSVSGDYAGVLEFRRDSADGDIIARFESEDNGAWASPEKRTANVTISNFTKGTFDLYVVLSEGTFGNLYGFQFYENDVVYPDAYNDINALYHIKEYYGFDMKTMLSKEVSGLEVNTSYIDGLGDDSTRNVEYDIDFGSSVANELIIAADVERGGKIRFYRDCPKGQFLQEIKIEEGSGEQAFSVNGEFKELFGISNICIAFDNNIKMSLNSFRFTGTEAIAFDDNTNYLTTDNYIDKSDGVKVITSSITSFMEQTTINEFVPSYDGDYLSYFVDFGKELNKKFIACDLRAKANGKITVLAKNQSGDEVTLATIDVSPRERETDKSDYSNITYVSLGSQITKDIEKLEDLWYIKVIFNGEADFCRLNSISFVKHYEYNVSNSAEKCHSWTTSTNKSGKLGGFDNINKYASWVIDFGDEDSVIKDVKINFSTSAPYHNEFVQIRLDSPDGEIVAEHMVNMQNKTNWKQYDITAPVLKEISGVHLVYITQSFDSKYSSCLNPAGDVFNIQFIDREEDVVTSSRVQSVYYHPKSGSNEAYYDDEMIIEKTVRFYSDNILSEKIMNIIAFYEKNGIIYKEFISDYDVCENMNIIQMSIDWDELTENGEFDVKGFVWDKESLAPLTELYEYMGNITVIKQEETQ